MTNGIRTAISDDAAFEKEGFPKKMVDAFLQTAAETNSVVMSRVPGGPTTELIEHRYDLKGYFIKAKSCNWGPMSGFLCRNPAFNKKGVQNIVSNWKSNEKYFEYLDKVLKKSKDFEPFRQIEITDQRWQSIKKSIEEKNIKKNHDNEIWCVATDDVKSVIAEFVLKRLDTKSRWKLLHGDIFAKKNVNGIMDDNGVLKNFFALISEGNAGKIVNPDKNFSRFDASTKFGGKQAPQGWAKSKNQIEFFEERLKAYIDGYNELKKGDYLHILHGITNPFPPYKGDEEYRNTVSGDYDLFAVWPALPPIGFEQCTRVSEVDDTYAEYNDATAGLSANRKQVRGLVGRQRQSQQDDDMNIYRQNMFLPVVGKRFALEITRSRNVFLEFVPEGQELSHLENRLYGNVNEAVFFVAQTLNAFTVLEWDKEVGKDGANVAFHSDEGGRPNVADVEYPIAVFLPKPVSYYEAFGNEKHNKNPADQKSREERMLMLRNDEHFMSLVLFCYARFYVFLNYGWFIDILSKMKNENDDALFEAAMALFARTSTLKSSNSERGNSSSDAVRSSMRSKKNKKAALDALLSLKRTFESFKDDNALKEQAMSSSQRMEKVRQLQVKFAMEKHASS